MSSGGLDFKVGADLLSSLAALPGRVKDARNLGLIMAGEHVLGVSNERVPHESGDLERSGAVSQDQDSGVTAISYDTDYAVKQHEDQSLSHDQGRQAKFLESALYENREQVPAIVANQIRKALGT